MARFYNPYGSKYKNIKVKNSKGEFDSAKEYYHFLDLQEQERKGAISNLRRQVPFILIPAQYEEDTIGPRGGIKKGKCLEKSCSYIADFVYKKDGELIVEDTKGFRTEVYNIKRKLMLQVHGIRIHEI